MIKFLTKKSLGKYIGHVQYILCITRQKEHAKKSWIFAMEKSFYDFFMIYLGWSWRWKYRRQWLLNLSCRVLPLIQLAKVCFWQKVGFFCQFDYLVYNWQFFLLTQCQKYTFTNVFICWKLTTNIIDQLK